MSFLDKFSNGVAIMIIQSLNSYSCYRTTYYRDVLSIGCGIYIAFAILSVISLVAVQVNTSSFQSVDEETPIISTT
ncbi:Uncharacterised protein r2_g631 [Pycnogonum litorale]